MKKIAASLFAVGAAIGGAVYYVANKGDKLPNGCKHAVVVCDTYGQAEGYSRKRFLALECAGEIAQPAVKNADPLDDFEIVGFCEKDLSKEIPKQAENVNFRCVHQPKDGGRDACMRLRKADGKFVDPGPENAFLAEEAQGDGCVPRPCAEVMGIPFKAIR